MNAPARTCALLLGLACSTAVADEPAALRANPFDRPAALAVAGAGGGDATAFATGGTIELRSTMVGVNTALANVGGRTLRPGEAIDGLELVAVFEDRAIFRRDGNDIVVRVKPAPDEPDE